MFIGTPYLVQITTSEFSSNQLICLLQKLFEERTLKYHCAVGVNAKLQLGLVYLHVLLDLAQRIF